MDSNIKSFYDSCIHCAATFSSHRAARPYGHAIHADKPNKLLHFDYIYIGASSSDIQYVLIIKDDASSYVWLHPTEHADKDGAVAGLLRWFSSFGVVSLWISDQGSHFKNTLMDKLNRALHARHHLTAPNAPQSNGTVERAGRELLRACRALLSEFQLNEDEWPLVLVIEHLLQCLRVY